MILLTRSRVFGRLAPRLPAERDEEASGAFQRSVGDVVDPGAREEHFLAIGVRLVRSQRAVLRAAAKLPVLPSSNRG